MAPHALVTLYWNLARAADKLVALANARGGLDNVTVVLVRVEANVEAA